MAAVISQAELPERALEIHRLRPDIQETFDLSTANGRSGLYWWYYIHAFREMLLEFRPAEDLKGPVNAKVKHLPVCGPIPLTCLMREFWRQGAVPVGWPADAKPFGGGPKASFRFHGRAREPRSRDEQRRIILWYFCRGLYDYNLDGLLTPEQADKLLEPGSNTEDVPLLLIMAHRIATDLHSRFPSWTTSEWRRWCTTDGRARFPIFTHRLIGDRLFGTVSTPATARVYEGNPLGVNLIGHAQTRSGVGEDLRMAARALQAAEIPFIIRNVEPSTGVASEETGLEPFLANHSPFTVNIFCMAGMENMTLLAKNRLLRDGKVNIGFWPWELPEWPKLWSHAPGLMDELWASTSFTAAAYRRSTCVPVQQVPMAVDVDATERLGRREFRLPEDRFLFGFSFDGHSSFSRKNPEAAVKAFRLAFPDPHVPAGLVLKGLRVSDNPEWHRLERLAAEDRRILLISQSMPRGALLDLYRALDCFVSLHRSEGFGRNIAESMLLGKPVIATSYSGNLDFTLAQTAALVSASLRSIRNGEYPFGAGQYWAEPSITEAAQHMRRIFLDTEWRARIARAGQQFIKTHYSPASVGEKFSVELRRIRKWITDGTTS